MLLIIGWNLWVASSIYMALIHIVLCIMYFDFGPDGSTMMLSEGVYQYKSRQSLRSRASLYSLFSILILILLPTFPYKLNVVLYSPAF